MKLIKILLLLMISSQGMASADVSVFVSFSMPKPLMIETLKECTASHIPVYLNGFVDDSMEKTIQKVMQLTKEVPNLNLQIDPTKFEDYHIDKVPAVVVSKDKRFDVIFGNLSIKESLLRLLSLNESGFNQADFKELIHD